MFFCPTVRQNPLYDPFLFNHKQRKLLCEKLQFFLKYSSFFSCIMDIVVYINHVNIVIKDNIMANIDFNLIE